MRMLENASQEEKIEFYRSVVRRYVQAMNDKDLEAVLALYADNAEVHDPIFSSRFTTKSELRSFYESIVGRAEMKIVGPICGSHGNVVATPVFGKLPGLEIDAITLTTFDDAGLIKHYAAYWGPSDIRQTTN